MASYREEAAKYKKYLDSLSNDELKVIFDKQSRFALIVSVVILVCSSIVFAVDRTSSVSLIFIVSTLVSIPCIIADMKLTKDLFD